MKKIITIYFLLILAGNCFGQQITFQKTYGGTNQDICYSAQQTTDGGYIITGSTKNFGASLGAIYLIKTDANGDTLWTKTLGGTGGEVGFAVQQTTDGGYIITGGTSSLGAGNSDVYLIKTDANGNPLWAKTFGGTIIDVGYALQQTSDGGYIITGAAGDNNVYLIKTDTNGDSLWTKTFGGINSDIGRSVRQTTDGGYIIAGNTSSFGAGSNDIYLIKTDTNGDSLWTKTYGGTNTEYGYSVQQTSDGGYIITGATYSFGVGTPNVYFIKTDLSGDTLWTKTFGGTGNDQGHSVQQTTDGGYIIGGRTTSFGSGTDNAYLIKTDGNGDTLWSKMFGGTGNDFVSSAQQTSDGGYFMAGISGGFGAGNLDVYLIKTDSMGNSGCNESSTATIVTTPATQVTSPPTVVSSGGIITSPATIVGGGGILTTLCTTVGIPSAIPNPQSAITISPNPTTNNFTITFTSTINKGVIEIYNVMGVPINIGINENVFNVSQKEIHLKNINAGIYFVKVRDGEKEYCKKLVIE